MERQRERERERDTRLPKGVHKASLSFGHCRASHRPRRQAVCKFIERHPLSGSRDSMKDFRPDDRPTCALFKIQPPKDAGFLLVQLFTIPKRRSSR